MGGLANIVTKLAADCSAASLDAMFVHPNKELLLSETKQVATLVELSITSVTTTGLLLPTDEPPLFLIT